MPYNAANSSGSNLGPSAPALHDAVKARIEAGNLATGQGTIRSADVRAALVDAEVVDLRSLRPLDRPTIIESVKKTNRAVVVEEGWPQNGVGAEISARVMEKAFDYLDAPPARVHQVDAPLAYAANLEALALPSVDKIVDAVKAVTYR